jgi:quercetin dioxygenase-like cupin family protein
MAQSTIQRKQLLEAVLDSRHLTRVDVREITLAPGQLAGRHLHPCPVVGYILNGTAIYQLEGEEEKLLPTGSAFYEPSKVIVAQFGNASSDAPMTFIAFYLLDGDEELIVMLDQK